MTLQKIDTMLPDSPPGKGKQEVLAQGLANVICGIFGSMGGCAMIGQSMINVRNGGIGTCNALVVIVSCHVVFRV